MNPQDTLNRLFGGMQSMRRATFLTAAALALAGTASAQHNLGLKLGQNGNGNQQAGAAGALLPTDLAGAPGYKQVNWNVLGRFGNNDTNSTSSGTNTYALLDSNGDDTHVTIQWDASGNWSIANGGTPVDQLDPDKNLMNPYCDSNGNGNVNLTNSLANGIFGQNNNNKPLIYLSGVQGWLATEGASQYDVVLYTDGDNAAGRTGEYWLQQAAGSTTNIIFDPVNSSTPGLDITTHVFIRDFNNFTANPAYQQVPFTGNINRVANGGNYTVFTGLSADSFVIRTAEFNTRSGVIAVQLIPRTTPIGPTIDPLLACTTYTGGTAAFRANVAGVVPFTYQWQKNGGNLTDGGNIAGSSTATLTISGVSAGDAASYGVVVSSPNGSTTSSTASLTVVTPAAGSYAEKIFTNNPVAYWRFNDSGDPSTSFSVAADSAGGFNAKYGPLGLNGFNGVVGPRPTDFPGFEANNAAMQTLNGGAPASIPYPSSYVSWAVAPPLRLNTNTVTVCAWIYPTVAQAGSTALLFARNTGIDVNGFGYGNNNNLGYTWAGNGNTFNFVSGLIPQSNTWSLVAYVISPTNAIIYLYNTNGQFSATNVFNHTNMVFGAPTMIGDDPSSTGTPQNRAFAGSIDEVTVFSRSLSDQDLYLIFKKGLNVGIIPAGIASQPVSEALYVGRTATFKVLGSGDKPLNYQWRANGVNLSNGGRISGATSPILTITSVIVGDTATYDVVVDNIAHAPVTSSPATLTVIPAPSPLTGYEAALQAANPFNYWRFNEASGSVYAYDYWGGNIATNENVTTGLAGPQPTDFPGLESTNAAFAYDGLTADTDTKLVGLNNNLTKFSIVGWFNAAGTEPARTGLFGQNDVTEFGFHGLGPDNEAQLGIWTPNGGAAYLNQSLITPNQWYFTAGVGDGTNLSLYLFTTNGAGGFTVSQSSTAAPNTNYGASAFSFKIGGGGILDATGNYFTGLIDEVAVFHRALSVGELSTLFGASLGLSALPPQITSQPAAQTLYAGRTAQFRVSVVGSATLTYQWRKNTTPLSDGGNISGSATATLSIANLVAGDAGNYDVVIANSAGTVTSAAAALAVITPTPGGFEAAMIAANPIAYYRLNETTDPTTGTAVANDYLGGHAGLYAVGVLNGFNGTLGPQPPNFTFDTSNYAISNAAGVLSSWVTAPFGSLSTNTVTMCMWIQPTGAFDTFAGLLVNRNSGVAGGFGYTGGQLGYTWNNNNANTYNFRSGLVPPLNEWSFVAMVVTPTNATIYMYNAQGELSAVNTLAHTSDVFGNNWRIGKDDNNNADDGSRTFTGLIDEVAVFNRSLTAAELRHLYVTGAVGVPDTLTIQRSGGNLILTWPYGMLLQADSVLGPWTLVPGNPASPYTVAPSAAMQFFRVQVQ